VDGNLKVNREAQLMQVCEGTAKNPVSSRNRVFIHSIALNQLYNYLAGVPPKLLFVGS
jgi:hypothetical protein